MMHAKDAMRLRPNNMKKVFLALVVISGSGKLQMEN